MSTRSVIEPLEARSLLSVAPSSLTATALSPTQLRLTWTDNTTIETCFLIDRSLDGVNWIRRTHVEPNSTSFVDTQVEQGMTYHYRLLATASNWRENSDWSEPAVGTTQLVRPTGVAANAIWSTIARVTWTDNSTNETGFLVSRSSDGKNWVQVAAATAGATTATDRTAQPGTKYDYRVKAVGTIKAANSDWSAGGTTVTLGTAAPTDIRVMAPKPTIVWVNWTDQSWNEMYFAIDRSTDGATWVRAGLAKGNKTGFTDTGVQGGKKYYYRVQALNVIPAWNSLWTALGSTTTPAVGSTVPAAPSRLKVTAAPTTQVDLSWSDNSSNESGFRIERSIDGGAWARIASVGEDVRSYTATELSGSTIYRFRVRAYNSVGTSGYTHATVMTPGPTVGGAPPMLLPGTGYVGPTPALSAYGLGPYADAKAIARWDVVPFQTFTGGFNVGVVAFHAADIERVSFSVNGGEWSDVYEMTTNAQTADNGFEGVVEYWATLDASKFQAGPVEVRAIAFPMVGEPRVLDSLVLHANPAGAQVAPVRYVSPTGNDANDGLMPQTAKKDPALAIASMKVDGGVPARASLYLLPGVHTWKHPAYPLNTTTQQAGSWLTIQAAPGYTRDDVMLRTDNAVNGTPYMMTLNRVRWHNVTFDSGLIPYMSAAGSQVWYDRVKVDGQDRFAPTTSFAFNESPGGRWITDSILTNLTDGGQGFSLMRNVAVSNTLTGGPWATPFVIHTTITNVDPGTTGAHPDLWRSMGSMENVILYGLRTPDWDKQGGSIGIALFSRAGVGAPLYEYDGIAFVNCDVSAGGGIGPAFAMGGVLRHVYVKDSTFRGGAGPDLTPGNYQGDGTVVFDGVQWKQYDSGLAWAGPLFPSAVYR